MRRILFIVALIAVGFVMAPQSMVRAQSGHNITLTWVNPTTGTPPTSVDVFRGTAAGAESATPIANVPSPGATYVDSSGTAGVTYFYYVKEKNQFGSAAASNEVSALFLGNAPAPATGLGAASN